MGRYTSLWYLFKHDQDRFLIKYFFSRPFSLIYKWFCKHPRLYIEKNCYFYGIKSLRSLQEKLSEPNSLLLMGISYCYRPSFCPSPRFSNMCVLSDGCQNCMIKKYFDHMQSSAVKIFLIPTVHAYAKTLIEMKKKFPQKKLYFLTLACDFSITMFSDFARLLDVQGAALALQGPVCGSMTAFIYAEKGEKKHSTFLDPLSQKQIISLLKSIKT